MHHIDLKLQMHAYTEIADLEQRPYTKTSSYIQLGKYLHQIQHWLNVFPREQILILNYDDLSSNPDAFLRQLFEFLELPNYSVDHSDKIYANQYPAVPGDIKQRLDSYFQPYNQELSQKLGINFHQISAVK